MCCQYSCNKALLTNYNSGFLRNKRNKMAIFALNFFLGWTLVGWVVSLVWSLTVDEGNP